jgi:hypothetical protein
VLLSVRAFEAFGEPVGLGALIATINANQVLGEAQPVGYLPLNVRVGVLIAQSTRERVRVKLRELGCQLTHDAFCALRREAVEHEPLADI